VSAAARLGELRHLPHRADARRNYEALLAAAGEMFAADGPEASLDKIARRAGVGNATLYRHFPTRGDLLVAVCVGEVEALCTRADELGPWLRAFVEHVTSQKGLAAALMSGPGADSAVIAACRAAIDETMDRLVDEAKRAGSVRPDLAAADLLALVHGVAAATESTGGEQADRLLRLIYEGIGR
jgi:AcrR family transcriptional regulator